MMENTKSSSHKKDKSKSSSSKKSSKHGRRERDDDESSSVVEHSKRKHRSDDERSESSESEREARQHHKSSSKKSHRDEKSSKKHRNEEKDSEREKGKSEANKDEEPASSASAGGDMSLSIDETNKLRAKLGLKPLSLSESRPATETKTSDDKIKKTYIDKDTNQEFEHMPAKNMAAMKQQKEMREKLQVQREKRNLMEKLRSVKGLGESGEEEEEPDESAQAWLRKLKEKEEAKKKEKMLTEMDEEFEKTEIVEAKKVKKKDKEYTADYLSGMRVEHDQTMIKEGQEIILTLKDKAILKGSGANLDVDQDEDGDVLVNVNIMDDERALKNLENKKNKPNYKPYDEFDEDGCFKQKDILDKYNEELNGEQKKSFKLGNKGAYDASDDKFIAKMEAEHKARAIKLDALNELKHATDYFTQSEMEKFKKPKKMRKVLRKNKMMKADDLLPLPDQDLPKPKSKMRRENEDRVESSEKIFIKTEETKEGKKWASKPISLKDLDFGFKKESDDEEEEEEDEYDEVAANKLREEEIEDMKQIIEEENNVLEELHSVLSKARKRVTASVLSVNNLVKQETMESANGAEPNGIAFENLDRIIEEEEEDGNKKLTLDTMSEFCRNLGSTENEEEEMEEEKKTARKESEDEEESEMKSSDDEKEAKEPGDESMEESEDKVKEEPGVLDEEPEIDRGLGGALKLAMNKGYIEQSKKQSNARLVKSSIEAEHYTVEEKNYYDIDDKYNRNRDRYSGPTSEFEEKRNYKPDVKLDYIDEKGHAMNSKEAFRYLSHRFHGKGSGKKKTEKVNKKFREMELKNKMSSVDTPLNTVALMVEKQKKLQQPYVVLSAPKGKQDQITLHKR